MNHCTRFFPIAGRPEGTLGITVSTIIGPFLIFSANSGDRISSLLDGRGIM